MSQITRTYTFTDGTTAYGSQVESEISNIVTTWNNHDSGVSSWQYVQATTLLKGKGTATNDSAAAGYIGEALRGAQASFTNITSTATWENFASVSATAGDWDFNAVGAFKLNGATASGSQLIAVSIYSATTTTDHVEGDNLARAAVPTATAIMGATVAGYRISLASTTTVYLKAIADFSAGNIQFCGRMSARRVR